VGVRNGWETNSEKRNISEKMECRRNAPCSHTTKRKEGISLTKGLVGGAASNRVALRKKGREITMT